MALNHSPQVVTNGLVYYHDMSNTQKSWKGAPTTNLTPDLSIAAIQAAPTVTYVGIEDGWKKYSLSGTWSAGTYPYSLGISAVAFTGGITYSSGVFIKTNVPSKFAALFTGMNYVNEPMNNGGTSFSITQPDGSIYVGRLGFQYTSTTTQTGYIVSQPVIGQVFNGATDFVYIKNGQVEINTFATPFVAGTRSNTQAIVDLVGANTITATGLTYNSNETFSFNGTGSISFTNPLSAQTNLGQEWTVIAWVNIDTSINQRLIIGLNSSLWLTTGSNSSLLYLNGGVNDYYTYGGAIGGVGWCQVVFRFRNSDGTRTIYKNGVNISTGGPNLTSIPSGNSGTFTLGTAVNGLISNTMIYNRYITDAEVKQNFNAFRGRYGL